MAFAGGEKKTDLKVIGTVGKAQHRHPVRFWPDPKYFDSPKFSVPRAETRAAGEGGALPGAPVRFVRRGEPGDNDEWFYEDGLADYLQRTGRCELVPAEPFVGHFGQGTTKRWTGRVAWIADEGRADQESYVNLIPTAQGGTHVNGLRTGLTEAIREFCEFRNLLPRGVKLTPDDVWDRVQLRPFGATEGPAVHRPDQGAAVLARSRGIRLRRDPGRLLALAQPHT